MYPFLPGGLAADAIEIVCYCFTVLVTVLSWLFITR